MHHASDYGFSIEGQIPSLTRDRLPELETLPSERADDQYPPEMDEIEADARAPRYLPGAKFVNVYLTDRAYGGPEEGGWWYDTAEAVRSAQALVGGDCARLLQSEREWCDEENARRRSDTGSVLSEGRYVVEIDDVPAADRPTARPHYE
jgi:hypothetical protein